MMNTPSSLIIRELESFSTMMRYEDMSEGQEEGSDLLAMKSPTEVTSCRSRSLQLVENHFTWILASEWSSPVGLRDLDTGL